MLLISEWLILLAGVLLAVSLPLLAGGSFALWLVAQAFYFTGLGVAVTFFFIQRRA